YTLLLLILVILFVFRCIFHIDYILLIGFFEKEMKTRKQRKLGFTDYMDYLTLENYLGKFNCRLLIYIIQMFQFTMNLIEGEQIGQSYFYYLVFEILPDDGPVVEKSIFWFQFIFISYCHCTNSREKSCSIRE